MTVNYNQSPIFESIKTPNILVHNVIPTTTSNGHSPSAPWKLYTSGSINGTTRNKSADDNGAW